MKRFVLQHKPYIQISQYKKDTVIRVTDGKLVPGAAGADGTKEAISGFSRKSARSLRLHANNTLHLYKSWVGLTYPKDYPVDGRETKKHLNAFLQWLRRKKARYLWVMEFQERGAVHYHVCVDQWLDRKELSERWYSICDTGDRKHLSSGTSIEAIRDRDKISGYIATYARKLEQKVVPDGFLNVGRFWGETRGMLKQVADYALKLGSPIDSRRALRVVRKLYASKIREWQYKRRSEQESRGVKPGRFVKWRWGGGEEVSQPGGARKQ